MSREDKRQREDGSAAGKVFAFIGVTLVVLILAALAAVFIITKGPSPAARAEFVRRTADSGLAFVTKLFVPGDEIEGHPGRGRGGADARRGRGRRTLGVRDAGRERRARDLRSPGRECRARDLRGPGRERRAVGECRRDFRRGGIRHERREQGIRLHRPLRGRGF